jgi:hypothetical protein
VDAFGVFDEVLGDYESFVKGFLDIQDDRARDKVEKEIGDGLLWPQPWLALNPAFESGGTVGELADRGVLHPKARDIFRARANEDDFGEEIAFHRHQTDAFEIANRRESYVLTIGTGSGKSMSYIVPIVFGIAKAADETSRLTATNVAVGSVAYAAPEQLTGKALGGRADQYALACTAFHFLTGEPPFADSNPAAVIGSHLSSPPPRLGTLRADLGSIVNVLAKGMAKEPFQRFDTCREFAAALSHGDAAWSSSVADTQFAATSPHRPAMGHTTSRRPASGQAPPRHLGPWQ